MDNTMSAPEVPEGFKEIKGTLIHSGLLLKDDKVYFYGLHGVDLYYFDGKAIFVESNNTGIEIEYSQTEIIFKGKKVKLLCSDNKTCYAYRLIVEE
jgi:hypothetical protein